MNGPRNVYYSRKRYTTDSIRLLDRMDLLRIRAEKTTEFRWQNENIERVFKRKSDKA